MQLDELIRQRFGPGTDFTKPVSTNKTIEDILNRRSCREFSSREVGEDLMQVLLATAFSAPSKSDLQQACVIRIRDKEKQQRIAELAPSAAWAATAPEFMIWCGDSRRIRRLCDWRQHPFANDHLDAFMNAAVDTGIAMQTFITVAESKGLGCCPLSEIRNNIEPLSSELRLPKWVFPVAGLCVGWPEGNRPVSMRLPLSVSVHADRYDDSDLVAQVSAYDRSREAVERAPPENQRMVDRFGIATEYGWSENRTRQYSVPARTDFGSYIRRQAFDLS